MNLEPVIPEVNTTRRTGKLTPAASVDVHVNMLMAPLRYASSMTSRSSIVKPKWVLRLILWCSHQLLCKHCCIYINTTTQHTSADIPA